MIQKIKNFFVKPNELFNIYKERPTWLLKTSIIGVVSVIFALITSYLSKDEMIRIAIEKLGNASQEQIDAIQKVYGAMSSPVAMAGIGVVTLISTFIIILITSLIYFGVIRLFDGKGKYSKVLAVYTLAYMPVVIGMILKAGYMYLTKSLAFIDLQPTYSSVIFSHFDLFILWQSILLVFGISTAFELPEKKSIVIVLSMWVLSILFSLGGVFIGSLFS